MKKTELEKMKKSGIEKVPTAEFIGYQERVKGLPFALYNIEGGKFDKSTVSARTLVRLGIMIPETPSIPLIKRKETKQSE